jgi:hypothetical protein
LSALAAVVANKVATSQLALLESSCSAVYASDGYQASVANLSQISLASDNVFSDGAGLQLPTISAVRRPDSSPS